MLPIEQIFIGIGAVVLLAILVWMIVLITIEVRKMIRYEEDTRFSVSNQYYVERSMRYMKDNHPDYFNKRYEKLAYIIFRGDTIVHTYLKEKQKCDNGMRCMVPWDYLRNMPVEGTTIVSIHQHPSRFSKIGGSWTDSLVHGRMLELFNHPVSIVTNKDMSVYTEYDDISSKVVYTRPDPKRTRNYTIYYRRKK